LKRFVLSTLFILGAAFANSPESALFNGRPVARGGPDGFGYYYQSSQDIGDTILYQWIDPCAGTAVTDWTPNPDDGYATLSLPFPFPFYGETLAEINVCSNGFLEASTATLYENTALPNSDIVNAILPFWDDLALGVGGTVYRYTGPGNSCFVVGFVDAARYDPPNDRETFEVVLFPDGRIRFNYRTIAGNRASNTIGIQGGEGGDEHFLQYVANGNPAGHMVRDSTSILFYLMRRDHDVGVSDVRSPESFVAPGLTEPVIARVKNFGQQTESFAVRGAIVNIAPPFDTVFRATPVTVSDLASQETTRVNLGDFTPGYEGTWQVKLFTELGSDEARNNDTARREVTNSAPFGTRLGSWNLTDLGTGYALSGITYCSDSNRFYVTAHDPNRVLSFAAGDPPGTLREEPFALEDFTGDDVVWGIAFDRYRHSFWIGHVEGSGSGTIAARYSSDGAFTGDTWNLWAVEAGAWYAGMDYDVEHDRFFVTKVSGTNRVYKLDLAGKRILGYVPGPVTSYRACSYLAAAQPWVISGGWNQNKLFRLDTLGAINSFAVLDSFADADVSEPRNPSPDSLVYVMCTLSNQSNTICKLSLGLSWRQLGVETPTKAGPDRVLLSCPSPQANPVRLALYLAAAAQLQLALFDLTGASVLAVRTTRGPGAQQLVIPELVPAGTYFLVVQAAGQAPQQKLVVVR
jgi:hypothetical protein